jgi:hypothetical protein
VAAFGRLWPPLKRAQKIFLAAFETLRVFWQPSTRVITEAANLIRETQFGFAALFQAPVSLVS